MVQATEKPRKTLYDLAGAYRDLYEQASLVAIEADGEVPDDLFEALDEAEAALEDKMENYGRLMKQFAADAEVAEAVAKTYLDEANKYLARAKHYKAQSERLKTRAYDGLTLAGVDSVDTEHFRFWLQNSTPSVVLTIQSPDELPDQFKRVTVSEDRKALADALKSKPESDEYKAAAGCARLEQGRHLRWK